MFSSKLMFVWSFSVSLFVNLTPQVLKYVNIIQSPCANTQVTPPATMSSNAIPVAPLTFWSSQLIGQGLIMSKNRKPTNTASISNHTGGNSKHATHIPRTSSITMNGKSCSPYRRVNSPKIVRVKKQKPATTRSCTHALCPIKKNHQMSSATTEAKVPGAQGNQPIPNPVAQNTIGFLKVSCFSCSTRVAVIVSCYRKSD